MLRLGGAARTTVVLAGLRAVLLAVLLAGCLTHSLALVVVASLAGGAAELGLQRVAGRQGATTAALLRGELHARTLLDLLLVVAYVLRSGAYPASTEAVLLVCVVAQQVLRTAFVGLQLVDVRLRQRPAEARGLPGAPAPLPVRSALLGEPGTLAVNMSGLAVTLALAVALFTGSEAFIAPGAVLSVLLVLVVVLAAAPGVAALARVPRGDRMLRLAHDAVVRHAPEVVLYSSGGVNDLHCIQGWFRTVEELGRPALILLRVPEALAAMSSTTTPALCLTSPRDLLAFRIPSARVALYVANARGNMDLLRDPNLRSAFIFHGDSDKALSANPVCKAYDEVWVAGDAGRQRYLDADVGVRAEDIRLVGRPQVRRVLSGVPPPSGAPYRVLYAPTWEGLYADPYESSLVHSGRDIVRVLLSIEGVQVVYRPHPSSGTRSSAFVEAHDDIVRMLQVAGAQHRVDLPGGSDLYDCFNSVDAMVADVSGVVSDFLASDKPYFVVDGRGLPDEQFRARTPSSGGAYLVGPGAAGLAAGVEAARGADPMRARRQQVRKSLIGPPGVDPLESFAGALDALGSRTRSASAAVVS